GVNVAAIVRADALLIHSICGERTRRDVGDGSRGRIAAECSDEPRRAAIDESEQVAAFDRMHVTNGARPEVDAPQIETQPAAWPRVQRSIDYLGCAGLARRVDEAAGARVDRAVCGRGAHQLEHTPVADDANSMNASETRRE